MKRLFEFIIKNNTTIIEAFRLLDTLAVKHSNLYSTLFIVDQFDQMIGTFDFTDFRRAIIKRNIALNNSIKEVMNKEYRFIYEGQKLTQKNYRDFARFKYLPVLDTHKKIINFFTIPVVASPKPNKVVIMAGGKGERLLPLTKDTPKPLLPIGEKSILEILISSLAHKGYQDIYISINYLADKIIEKIGDGRRFDVNIHYIEEKQRLGTAGSLKLIHDSLDEPIVVMNGDILTSVNFDDVINYHNSYQSYATMCVKTQATYIPYGVIGIDNSNRIVTIQEKPEHQYFINAGIYVLNPHCLDFIPENGYFDMTMLFDRLIKEKLKLNAYIIHDYWIDIGRFSDYEKAKIDFLEHNSDIFNSTVLAINEVLQVI